MTYVHKNLSKGSGSGPTRVTDFDNVDQNTMTDLDDKTLFEEQKQYLRESIRISHDEMIETMKETIEIEKSNFKLPEFNKKI